MFEIREFGDNRVQGRIIKVGSWCGLEKKIGFKEGFFYFEFFTSFDKKQVFSVMKYIFGFFWNEFFFFYWVYICVILYVFRI